MGRSIPSFRQHLLEIEKQKRKKFKFYRSHLASSLDKILQFPLFLQSGHHFCCKTSPVSLPLGSATFLLPHSHLITRVALHSTTLRIVLPLLIYPTALLN